MMYLGDQAVGIAYENIKYGNGLKIKNIAVPQSFTLADKLADFIISAVGNNATFCYGINNNAVIHDNLEYQYVHSINVTINNGVIEGSFDRENNGTWQVMTDNFTSAYGARATEGDIFTFIYKEVTPNA